MASISYKRHRFPRELIQHAVWLYFRFTLSLRDVEEMLAQRGIEVSYETIRCWTMKFGSKIAACLRRRKAPPSPRWHLDEMVSTIGGERVYTWRAVDAEGEVMDMLVQKQRDTRAALRLMRRLLRNQHVEPETIVTDGLRSYSAALEKLDLIDRHRPGRLRDNNRAENSHLSVRRRERKMQGFKSLPISAALSRDACCRLQHIQLAAAFAEPQRDARPARTLGICLEQGGGVMAGGLSKGQQNRWRLG